MNNATKKAFSLVEISVVILIVGILIVGISRGADLYQDYRLSHIQSLTRNSIVNRTDGLTLWLETTLTQSFSKDKINNNELISRWNDINPRRPVKMVFTQSNISKQPTYIRNGINGLPVLNFSSATQLVAPNISTYDLISHDQVSLFIVRNGNDSSASGNSLTWFNLGLIIRIDSLIHPMSNQFWFGCCSENQRTSLSTTNNTARFKNQIFSVVKNGNVVSMRSNYNLNQSAEHSETARAQSSSGAFSIGYLSTGQFAEIIIFNRALSESERFSIESYLSKKWGIRI